MCVKAVNTYFFCQYKSQKMCDKAFYDNGYALEFVPDWYKTQEMCDKFVTEDSRNIS